MWIGGPVSMRYRSSETNYQYEYRHNGCLLTANVLVYLFFNLKFILVQLAETCKHDNCQISLISLM